VPQSVLLCGTQSLVERLFPNGTGEGGLTDGAAQLAFEDAVLWRRAGKPGHARHATGSHILEDEIHVLGSFLSSAYIVRPG
jgi:hypothetical protein